MSKGDWNPAEFQKVIQAWLDRTGMSQKAAADTCGFSQSVINRWMSPDPDSVGMRRIAREALGRDKPS